MKIKEGYTFDDLLLVPQYSEIKSRSEVNTSVNLGKGFELDLPIVSANMASITGLNMARKLVELGGLPILHRFNGVKEQLDTMFFSGTECWQSEPACSVGVQKEDRNNVDSLIDNGCCNAICVDVAHGDHKLCLDMVSWIAKKHDGVLLIAGNVATGAGAIRLYDAGADVIKIGIGAGSLCSTRIETGNGVPMMTALHDVYQSSLDHSLDHGIKSRKFKIIADGGIRTAGDCVKSLCYADAVMLGSLLAGTDEAPGEIKIIDGIPHKAYEGSSTYKTSHVEGVKALVPYKGPVEPIIRKLMEGIRSGLSYQGCYNLDELKENPQFVKVTNAGLIESHPHNVIIS